MSRRPLHWVLDEHGEPVPCGDLETWARWFEAQHEEAHRTGRYPLHVDRTVLGKVLVSTVFLAIDHNFSDHGPPVLYETMVFGPDVDDSWRHEKRHYTRTQAQAYHDQVVAGLRATLPESTMDGENTSM
jgi:hypothetical protein